MIINIDWDLYLTSLIQPSLSLRLLLCRNLLLLVEVLLGVSVFEQRVPLSIRIISFLRVVLFFDLLNDCLISLEGCVEDLGLVGTVLFFVITEWRRIVTDVLK